MDLCCPKEGDKQLVSHFVVVFSLPTVGGPTLRVSLGLLVHCFDFFSGAIGALASQRREKTC